MFKIAKVRVKKSRLHPMFIDKASESESLGQFVEKNKKVREKWGSKNAENREFLRILEKIENTFIHKREFFRFREKRAY